MQCSFKKSNGKRCKANSTGEGKTCYFHSEEHKEDAQVARSRGGQAKAIVVKEPLPPMKLQETQDVIHLLEDTINRVRSGELDVKIGNCIGVLSGQLIKAIEVSSIVNRVEIIERAILERRTTF